jgi:hypothetical protein
MAKIKMNKSKQIRQRKRQPNVRRPKKQTPAKTGKAYQELAHLDQDTLIRRSAYQRAQR